MKTHNAENERIKRRYFTYLKEAKRYSEPSIDAAAKALHRFETDTRFRDFKAFRIEQAIAFKRHLAGQRAMRTGMPLSKATLYSTLAALRAFFLWLAGQPGFRSRLTYSDADYFSLSEKETRVAKAHREQPVPTLEQIHAVLRAMAAASDVDLRDRALVAFVLLTGVRDGAVASLKIKHLDIANRRVIQDAREVRTKFSKSSTTCFFPVAGDAERIVVEWVGHLRDTLLFGPDDPLFPKTRMELNAERQFRAAGLVRKHWSNAGPIRRIFKRSFLQMGLPYFGPHSFRKTLAQLGERLCTTPEQFKAWSQNMSHEHVSTTLTSYGAVSAERQAEILAILSGDEEPDEEVLRIARELAEAARRGQVKRGGTRQNAGGEISTA